MPFKAIRLTSSLGQEPVRLLMGEDLRSELNAARDAFGPAAFIVPDEAVGSLDACRDLILDRGRKHPSKPLAAVLLGHERIPLVRGGHTSSGQLLRSVRALLDRARQEGDRNLFLVTAAPDAFAEVWARAVSPPLESPAALSDGPPAAAPRVPVADGAGSGTPTTPGDRPGSSLFALLQELPVPDPVRERFVGTTEEVRTVHQLLLRAAALDDPVLILGDTGTGKEVVARLIHDQSGRRYQTFTPVNCGAIPRELLESELFGYEKGAHSTATARKLGLWRTADGGTLFLDEIADLSLDHQVKILRALEYGEIRPVGAERAIQVNARVIAATNRDLFGAVRGGAFREDLYYRLRSFMIRTPALRDHPEDTALLAMHFWTTITGDPLARLPADVVAELVAYRWPGNARELKMVLTTLHALFGGRQLTPSHLRAVFEFEGQAGGGAPAAASELGLHRVECLRRLRRTDEILRAAQVDLGRLSEGAASADRLARRAAELEQLCDRPLLFHGEGVFTLVRQVAGTLQAVAVGAGSVDAAVERVTSALSAVFKEVEKLLLSAAPH